MKILYLVNNVSNIGGIAKILSIKAKFFIENYGHEIFIIESDRRERKESVIFSPLINRICLDINYNNILNKNKFNPFSDFNKALRLHKRKLKNILINLKPDIVITLGEEDINFIASIKGNWKLIREYHWTTRLRHVLYNQNSIKNKILTKLANLYESKILMRNFNKIVILSENEKKKFYKNNNNIIVIPNPKTFYCDNKAQLINKKLISIGRLSVQKNFSSLIRIFKKVNEYEPEWILEIYGDGPEKNKLQKMISEMNLYNKVFLKGSTTQIKDILLDSTIFLLSSLWEGMPLVILEAMTCGLPVLSYKCPSGPADLIIDGENGFLIPQGSESLFADRIIEIIKNKELRSKMGQNSKKLSNNYNLENIMFKWQNLFTQLMN